MKNDNLIGYKQNIIRCNLGFRYALICGTCWGMAYILITSVMKIHQSDSYSLTMLPTVLATATTFMVAAINLVWIGSQDKTAPQWSKKPCRTRLECRYRRPRSHLTEPPSRANGIKRLSAGSVPWESLLSWYAPV